MAPASTPERPTCVLQEGRDAAVRLEVFYAGVCVAGLCVRLNPKHKAAAVRVVCFSSRPNSSGTSDSPCVSPRKMEHK
ncbi:hypothetical protein E2C01_085945 [Portunus trituberculatus]|uniref:Uncharacterized protein n=1 Tax=Portunus trituberculatus TaxID=210409 RepID=A0A5B7IZG9_PORTR|nr:hypothetical protein [Portunus trituberculatus]